MCKNFRSSSSSSVATEGGRGRSSPLRPRRARAGQGVDKVAPSPLSSPVLTIFVPVPSLARVARNPSSTAAAVRRRLPPFGTAPNSADTARSFVSSSSTTTPKESGWDAVNRRQRPRLPRLRPPLSVINGVAVRPRLALPPPPLASW
jgi:hypothetical protein